MNLIEVEDTRVLDRLREHSALTLEGLDGSEENMEALLEWIGQFGTIKERRLYRISGKFMNAYSGLTGSNAYQDDLDIISFDFYDDMELDGQAMFMQRFAIGGRWMDDVCDNNERRESRKKRKTGK